jgi:hypothetical protein
MARFHMLASSSIFLSCFNECLLKSSRVEITDSLLSLVKSCSITIAAFLERSFLFGAVSDLIPALSKIFL